jgi:hypothetical protein
MVSGAQRQQTRVFASALAMILTLSGGAAQAACYGAGQLLPTQVVSRFLNDPAKLLSQFPNGGPQMISLIRDLVASEPGSLPLIAELNDKANIEQVQAIGTGLGQAALVCARNAQAFSDEIQRVTIAASNKPMIQAFGAVMGDQFLGLAGPAAGGGGAGSTAQNASATGTVPSGAPLSLTTAVSSTTGTTATASTVSAGLTFGAAAVTGGGSASAGASGGRASSGNPGGIGLGVKSGATASVGNPGGTVSEGNLGITASVRSSGGATLGVNSAVTASAGNSGGAIFGANAAVTTSVGNSGGTIFGGSPDWSAGRSVRTPNFTTNVNSPISVSPSR